MNLPPASLAASTRVLQGYEARGAASRCSRSRTPRATRPKWFENVNRYTGMPIEQFAYSLLTRSQRISHENLRLRDRLAAG